MVSLLFFVHFYIPLMLAILLYYDVIVWKFTMHSGSAQNRKGSIHDRPIVQNDFFTLLCDISVASPFYIQREISNNFWFGIIRNWLKNFRLFRFSPKPAFPEIMESTLYFFKLVIMRFFLWIDAVFVKVSPSVIILKVCVDNYRGNVASRYSLRRSSNFSPF